MNVVKPLARVGNSGPVLETKKLTVEYTAPRKTIHKTVFALAFSEAGSNFKIRK